MVKDSDIKTIKNVLEIAHVCKRCQLRYFGSKEYKNYLSKSDVEKAINELIGQENKITVENSDDSCLASDETVPPLKRLSPNPCPACLGILQDACDEMVLRINNEVIKSKHKFKDFVLQVSLPVVIDLRERLFHLYLKEKLSESYCVLECEVPSVKDICKWVIGSQFGKLSVTDFTPYSDFQILISASYPETVKECFALFKECPNSFPNARKRNVEANEIYTRTAVVKAMDVLSLGLKNLYALPPTPPDKCCSFSDIKLTHSPVYLGGRYNKYSRELSQTPWILDGERKMDSSVQELITDIVEKSIEFDKIIFSASGREDVDVQMLGNGRPFLLEMINPRCFEWSKEELKAIEDEINSNTDAIAVKQLQIISKEEILLLKEGEEQKKKTYRALCLVEKTLQEDDVIKLENLTDVTLHQKTPIRVLHRRSLSTRPKLIHSMKATIVSEHLLKLDMVTQAGTYVKEFVHGDFGRTSPSLGSLLNSRSDILELDVVDIDLEWPPHKS